MAASSGDYDAAYERAAAKTLSAFAAVGAMAHLVGAGLALGIQEIGDGGAAHFYGRAQDVADGLVEARGFLRVEARGQACRMNARAPQAFIRVDVSHAAKGLLIEQKRLDSGAAPGELAAEGRERDE
jgi:hypothetical protein